VTGDDDIAAALPKPPYPAPARREAAIGEALRRFDGGPARPAPAAEERRPPLWTRPYAGALAGAFLVAIVGLPFVWTAFDNYEQDGRKQRPGIEADAPVAAGPDRTKAVPAPPAADPLPPAAADKAEPSPSPERPALADGPAPAAAEPDAAARDPAADAAAETSGGDITVTGTRIQRPNLESAMPVTSVGSEEFRAGDRRAAARAARRGDWNACTIDDPGQSLERCRGPIGTVARGARGEAAEPLSDGLASAWKGDFEGATASFDRAIALSPRSSTAWLNRGLAWRRLGDLDKALADLDRAVLYAPNDARAYYHRALVHRERGDPRRARADEERAVQLDPRYAPLVRTR
jgi:tetratricopeptide (TPR) repeat protein